MDSSVMLLLEDELSELWRKHGSSPKQRDAWYWGFVIGVEIESKKKGLPSKTNYISCLEISNPQLLKRHTNRLFIRKGFSIQEKIHFDTGISNGKFYIEKMAKNKQGVHI